MIKKQLDNFFYWMEERQAIYLKKEAGKPKPWTKDVILQRYKFTNVFRQQDRVTVELGKRLNKNDPKYLTLWKIIVFRMFNWPDTYDALNEAGLIINWNEQRAKKLLRTRKGQIFTGAYIITNAGSTRPKIDLICEALDEIHTNRKLITMSISSRNSIEWAVKKLSQYPHIGKFVGYEIATDLRHTSILNNAHDIYTWANPGPGAMRGLNRIFRGDKAEKTTRKEYLIEMQELLTKAVEEKILSKYTLEMRDIEHSLCEFDKYMRVFNNEGRPRSKYNGTG